MLFLTRGIIASCLVGLFFSSIYLNAEQMSVVPEVFKDGFNNLDNWTNVSGSQLVLVTNDQSVSHAPYARIGSGLAKVQIPFNLKQSFELKMKVKHDGYGQNLWFGMFNESGTKGYCAYWDSSNQANYNGNGFVNIRKHDRTTELLDWQPLGNAISGDVNSQHNVLDSEFADISLSWERSTGIISITVDGQKLVSATDTAFNNFCRIYIKSTGWSSFDEVTLKSGRDSELVTVNQMFNKGSFSEGGTQGNVILSSPWKTISGTFYEVQDEHERALSSISNNTRAELPLPNHGQIVDYPKVALSYDIKRTNQDGNSGGVFLVNDSGQGIGFITELASESLGYTTLKLVATNDAGGTWSILSTKVWYGVSGTKYHNINFLWDRSTHEVKAVIDREAVKTLGNISTADINDYSRLVVKNVYSNNLRFDNLSLIRIPANCISILDYGAVADGGETVPTDNTTAITSAISAAGNLGCPVFFPLGSYSYSNVLTLTGIKMIGCGSGSKLISTNEDFSTIKLTGNAPAIIGCSIEGCATRRITLPEGNGIWAYKATNFIISANRVYNVATAGIFVHRECYNGKVCGNIVSESEADGIHHTGDSHFIQTFGNAVFNPGDDQIAVVSYAPGCPPCSEVEAIGNYCYGQHWGRGMTVVGGNNILYTLNDINHTFHAGMYINSESSYNTYGGNQIYFVNNVVRNSSMAQIDGVPGNEAGQAGIYLSSRDAYPGTEIMVLNNRIYNSNFKGLYIGSSLSNITIDNNFFDFCSDKGAHIIGSENIEITNNEFKDIGLYGIMAENNISGNLLINNNSFTNINTSNTLSYIDVMLFLNSPSLSSLNVTNNNYDNPGNYMIERYIENHVPAVISNLANNTTSTSAPIWQAP